MENFRQRNKMTVEYEEKSGYNNKEAKNTKEKNIYEISIDAIKAKRQCKLIIEGIEVYFPYPPYSNQLAYMEKGNNIFYISDSSLQFRAARGFGVPNWDGENFMPALRLFGLVTREKKGNERNFGRNV